MSYDVNKDIQKAIQDAKGKDSDGYIVNFVSIPAMLTVFLNRKGDVMFTYPNVDLHQGDRIKFRDQIYLVVSKTFVVENGTYEILLHKSKETE